MNLFRGKGKSESLQPESMNPPFPANWDAHVQKRRWVKATLTTAVPGPWFVHISLLVYNFEKSQSRALSQAFLSPSLIGCIVTTSFFLGGVVAPYTLQGSYSSFSQYLGSPGFQFVTRFVCVDPNILAVRVFSLSQGLSVLRLCSHIL